MLEIKDYDILSSHIKGNLQCEICLSQIGYPNIEICTLCGGVIHVEHVRIECSKDYSDSLYEYKCDLCGDTDNNYLISNGKKTVAELRQAYKKSLK